MYKLQSKEGLGIYKPVKKKADVETEVLAILVLCAAIFGLVLGSELILMPIIEAL